MSWSGLRDVEIEGLGDGTEALLDLGEGALVVVGGLEGLIEGEILWRELLTKGLECIVARIRVPEGAFEERLDALALPDERDLLGLEEATDGTAFASIDVTVHAAAILNRAWGMLYDKGLPDDVENFLTTQGHGRFSRGEVMYWTKGGSGMASEGSL